MAPARALHGETMDLTTFSTAVATAVLATIILQAVFFHRVRNRLNEWAARQAAGAEKRAKKIAEQFKEEMEGVESTIAALRSERMRAVATFRHKKQGKTWDDHEEEDDDSDGVMKWLNKMAENPIVRAMARKNDIDVDALVSGDEEEWERLDAITKGKKPPARTEQQESSGSSGPGTPPAQVPTSFL